ncbi:hypothetical protein RB195_001679 [Necator americanus]|uniref:7TM GPCR serpentine receptor class x (Srx) domain-containing protein n=1 Tax=Necator americanus TaxID=51031 RepID=A0ABR1DGB4_NECAM
MSFTYLRSVNSLDPRRTAMGRKTTRHFVPLQLEKGIEKSSIFLYTAISSCSDLTLCIFIPFLLTHNSQYGIDDSTELTRSFFIYYVMIIINALVRKIQTTKQIT